MYAAMREDDPVHHVVPTDSPGSDYYVLSRHADVLAAAVDTGTYSSAHGLTVEYDELERIGMADNPPLVMLDPPDHTAFRKLVARGFTPRAAASLEPQVRAFVVDRLDALVAAGGGDLVADLFKPLPSLVVAHYLGVPGPDRGLFDRWTEAIVEAGPTGSTAGAADAAEATTQLLAYFSDLIERRRREPGDDTVSHLVAAGVADDDRGLLSVLAYVFTVVTGGNDTTTGNLGGAALLLARHPDQRALLAARPDLVPDAVEEFLRLTSPVQGLARTLTRDVTLHGVTMPAGRKVLLLYAAANRDPRQYGSDADDLDVRRRPTRLLTFSQGSHHCIGAAAARLQAVVALEELLVRAPDYTVDETGVTWAAGRYVRRPLTLPFHSA